MNSYLLYIGQNYMHSTLIGKIRLPFKDSDLLCRCPLRQVWLEEKTWKSVIYCICSYFWYTMHHLWDIKQRRQTTLSLYTETSDHFKPVQRRQTTLSLYVELYSSLILTGLKWIDVYFGVKWSSHPLIRPLIPSKATTLIRPDFRCIYY